MDEFFDNFYWNSCVGINDSISPNKKLIQKMANTKEARLHFYAVDGTDYLINKSSRALWTISSDGNTIEPVFSSEILTEDDLNENNTEEA